VLMRTTLDLPDQLMKQTKMAAVERGVTVRELIAAAVARDLAAGPPPKARKRVPFPVFSSAQPGSLHPTNADVARAEAAEDLRRHGGDP